MGYKTLTIPKPCNQQWNNMDANADGKFCHACANVVADFTKLSDDELVKVLQAGTYTCCRLNARQVDKTFEIHTKNLERKKYWTSIAAAIVAGMLQLSISYGQTTQAPAQLTRIPTSRLQVRTDLPVAGLETLKEKQVITFLVTNQKSKKILSSVKAVINEEEISFTSDSLGMVRLEVPEGMGPEDEVNITFSKYRYFSKTIRVNLGQALKKNGTVRLSFNKKSRGHLMGCPSF